MYKLTQLGNEPMQEIEFLLEDNSSIMFHFEYKANQAGWFFSYKYGDIENKNIRITRNYNMLRSYRNYLPFGARCDTKDGYEPIDIDDFASGYAEFYVLTPEDVEATEGNYFAKV